MSDKKKRMIMMKLRLPGRVNLRDALGEFEAAVTGHGGAGFKAVTARHPHTRISTVLQARMLIDRAGYEAVRREMIQWAGALGSRRLHGEPGMR